ncbi:transcriptional regulator ATRX homolog [Odontomachus brunneus]|uniref:transcriptional regulator ATRX homolog n=1 Tax=Odontomachus brunneus TaxID=486640 RepID=UPI0013F28965|nr:transcriptional regulator ATRX homolog [Odontomachus brunneus]
MRNRLHDCVHVFALALLLEISLAPIRHAETINVTRRVKREISEATSQPRQNANYDAKEIQEVNLKYEKGNGNVEENNTFLRQKREVPRNFLNSIDDDFLRSNVEKSVDDNAVNHLNLPDSNEKADYAEEADDEITRRREYDEDEETSNLVRLSRSADLKYIDQDEGSSLYDDYEVKDVAKRGAEDYEEVEEDSPDVLEDMAAVREEESAADEAERRETRSDARVKRNQATSGSLDNNVKSNASDLLVSEGMRSSEIASELRLDSGNLEESKVDEPSSRQVSNVELSRGIDEPLLPNNGASNKLVGFASNEAVSSSSGASAEDASVVEKRAEERIRRKIDSMKDEIRRDIEAQRRIRDIQENNAKFDELQEEESRNFADNSIEKRQSMAKKRSIRDVEAVASSKNADKKRSPKRESCEKPQRRSSETDKSDNKSRKHSLREKPKRRFAKHRDESSKQSPSKGFFKKKRERARETILVKKDRQRAKKKHSRSYALPSGGSDGKLGNELALNQDLNSYLRANDETVRSNGNYGKKPTKPSIFAQSIAVANGRYKTA